MLEKNRHLLAIEAIQVLRKSSNKTVRALFQSPVTKTGNLYSQVIVNEHIYIVIIFIIKKKVYYNIFFV